MTAVCVPTRLPPNSRAVRPISAAARRMPGGIGGIGRDEDRFGVGRPHRAQDRRVIRRRGRIGFVIDDVQSRRHRVLPRAVGRVAGELGVGADDRQCFRLRIERFDRSKKPCENAIFGLGPVAIMAKQRG